MKVVDKVLIVLALLMMAGALLDVAVAREMKRTVVNEMQNEPVDQAGPNPGEPQEKRTLTVLIPYAAQIKTGSRFIIYAWLALFIYAHYIRKKKRLEV